MLMQQKTYLTTAAVIFLIIAVLHLLRVLLSWSAIIGGWQVPMWLSWAALIVAGYLAYAGFKLNR